MGRGSSTPHSRGAPHPLRSSGKHSTKVNQASGPARSFSIESGPLLDNKALLYGPPPKKSFGETASFWTFSKSGLDLGLKMLR